MVHYDVKLLNFFLHNTPSATSQVQLPWGQYQLINPSSSSSLPLMVRLGDFGTAEIQIEGELSVGQVYLIWSMMMMMMIVIVNNDDDNDGQ